MTNPYRDEFTLPPPLAYHEGDMHEAYEDGHAAGAAEVAALRTTLDVAFRALEAAKEETDGTDAHAIVMSALSLKKPAATTTATDAAEIAKLRGDAGKGGGG